MAYTRTTWVEGGAPAINAANLNKIEQGLVDAHAHMARTDNPHGVTKAQIGLGNVTNVAQASATDFNNHLADKTNPHNVTTAQVNNLAQDFANGTDLGNKYPLGISQFVVSAASGWPAAGGMVVTYRLSDYRTKQYYYFNSSNRVQVRDFYVDTWTSWSVLETEAGAQSKVDEHANNKSNPHGVTTAQIGALPASSYTAADVLAKLKTVDGHTSGIDADLLDGQQGSYYLAASSYTASDVLAKLKTVDGSGSGLDADTLDGKHVSSLARMDERTDGFIWVRRAAVGGAALYATQQEAEGNIAQFYSGDGDGIKRSYINYWGKYYGDVEGTLTHNGGYFDIHPYSSAHGSGGVGRMYWNETDKELRLYPSSGGTANIKLGSSYVMHDDRIGIGTVTPTGGSHKNIYFQV